MKPKMSNYFLSKFILSVILLCANGSLITPITIKCYGNHLQILGKNIKFSNFLNSSYFSANVWNPSCHGKNVKKLSVFADTLLEIDKDLFAQGLQLSVVLVSPSWHIHGKSRTISLRGADGESMRRSADGNFPGGSGGNGRGGYDGTDGGILLGIYENLHHWNRTKLHIFSDGGNGGKGQDGGNGAYGKMGQNATLEDFQRVSSTLAFSYFYNTQNLQKGRVVNCVVMEESDSSKSLYHTAVGKAGNKGGNGGNGGDGGRPGEKGFVQMLNLGRSIDSDLKLKNHELGKTCIVTSNNDGLAGLPGKGGIGGRGGQYGDFITCRVSIESLYFFQSIWENCEASSCFMFGSSGKDGYSGRLGGNPAPKYKNKKFWKIQSTFQESLAKYKNRLYKDRFSNETFVAKLDTSLNMYPLVNPFSLDDDLFDLERLYYVNIQPSHFKLLKLYKLHLNRVNQIVTSYANNITDLRPTVVYEGTDFQVLAFNHILAWVASRIVALTNQQDGKIIFTSDAYFAKTYLKKFDIIKQADAFSFIHKQEEIHANELSRLYDNILRYDEMVVEPSLKSSEDILLSEMGTLYSDMINAPQQIKCNSSKDEKYKYIVENRIVLGALKITFYCTKYLLGAGIKIAENVSHLSNITKTSIFGDLSYTSSSNAELRKWTDNKLNCSDGIIKKVSQLPNNIKTFLSGINATPQTLIEGKQELRAATQNNHFVKILDCVLKLELASFQLAKVLRENLEKIEDISNNKQLTTNQEIRSTEIHRATNMTDILTVVRAIIAQAELMNTDFDSVGSGANYTNTCMHHFTQESNTFNEAHMFVLDMHESIGSIETILNESVKISLARNVINIDLSRVRILISNLRRLIAYHTKHFILGEEIKLFLHNVQSRLLAVEQLFEKVESYKYQKLLASYVSDIEGGTGGNLNLIEIHTLRHMETEIQCGLLLKLYHCAENSFKIAVFPFAKQYFDAIGNSTSFTDNKPRKLENTEDFYSTRIAAFASGIKNYTAAVENGGGILQVINFTSHEPGRTSFYTWRSKDWPKSIQNFLSGMKIQLFANLDSEPTRSGKAAIKFKSIAFVIRAQNESDQQIINYLLRYSKVNIVHSGVSHYYAGSNKYIIHENSVSYIQKFEHSAGQFFTSTSTEDKKTGNGAILSSPYTMWTVQLEDASLLDALNNTSLKQVLETVDLNLEGTGVYIDECSLGKEYIKEMNIESYYQRSDENFFIPTFC